MSSLTDNLKLMDLVYGEEGAYGYTNWGDLVDANFEFLEDALTEKSDITVTTANITLDDDQQRSLYLNLSGALTGNREIILKASQKGLWFVTNGTTGSYTITIKPSAGSGFVLDQGKRAWVYSDGSTAIQIIRPSDLAGYETVSSDADFTLTWNSNAETIRHTGTLTADRAVTLSTAGAVKGARWRIARTGSGAFNLNIGTGPLKALRQNMWADFVYDGSAWYLDRFGAMSISTFFTTNGVQVRTAADTFAGRTITGTTNEIDISNGDGISGNPTVGLADEVNITTSITIPNEGLKVKDTNASHVLTIKPGSNLTANRTLTITTGDADVSYDMSIPPGDKFSTQLLHVANEQAQGTAATAAPAATWTTVPLNTVRTNEISGASLATNEITLLAGTYFIDASSMAWSCEQNKARLYNVTDASVVKYSTNEYNSADGVTPSSSQARIVGRFTIAGTKVLRIDHYSASIGSLGRAMSQGVEIYAEALIWKVA